MSDFKADFIPLDGYHRDMMQNDWTGNFMGKIQLITKKFW